MAGTRVQPELQASAGRMEKTLGIAPASRVIDTVQAGGGGGEGTWDEDLISLHHPRGLILCFVTGSRVHLTQGRSEGKENNIDDCRR